MRVPESSDTSRENTVTPSERTVFDHSLAVVVSAADRHGITKARRRR
jgi:hypothetical protein